MNKPVYIVSPIRTSIGSFLGTLSSLSAVDLGSALVQHTLKQTGISPELVEQIILGCVLTSNLGQAPARQVAIYGGLKNTTQALTINKVCSSGLKAVMLASDAVSLGHADCVIAGGMESMSQAPYLLPKARIGARYGNTEMVDSIIKDGLFDVYNKYLMGCAAELCAKTYSIAREEQDAYATESYTRALNSIKNKVFDSEIAPITVKQGKDEIIVSADEEPGKGKLDKFATLKPAFDLTGTVTAANASSLNDGAAIMIICSEEFIKKSGLKPDAKILSQGWHAREPEFFTVAPVDALKSALTKAGKTIAEIDRFEINEAFSVVAIACQKQLGIDSSILNINGGAVALGHPIGASGARILVSLVHELKRSNKKLGAAAICNGGGEATAVVVERF